MGIVNSVELILTRFTSSSSVPLLEKLRRGLIQLLTKRRKEGTLDTDNKNGCFRWAWLMNWTVWKHGNHIMYTEGIQSFNPSSRQTVSSHQDNIDCFLCGVNPPKTCSQTCQTALLFYETFRTKIISSPPNTSLEESKTSISTD